MAWRAINVTDCKFTPAELTALAVLQGANSGLQTRLTDVAGEFLGAIAAAGYPVASDGSVPDQLRGHILARTAWLFLNDFPALKALQTDGRKSDAAAAEAVLEKIVTLKYGAIENPNGPMSSAGNWNSENRLVLRTHPAPRPAQQSPPSASAPGYANPNGPADD